MRRAERTGWLAEAKRSLAKPRRQAAIVFVLAALLGIGAFLSILPPPQRRLGAADGSSVTLAAALGLLLSLGALWLFVDRRLLRAMLRLAADVRFIAEARADNGVDPNAYPGLGPLPEATNHLVQALLAARREVEGSVASATRRIDEQKERLEAILRDLSEGVMICNLDHQVLLYNHVALALLHVSGDLGLGRSLFKLISQEPILHALDRLLQRRGERLAMDEATVSLVCSTADSRALLRGRMSLVVDAGQRPRGYVLTLIDATRDIAELDRRDALLRAATEGLRAPIANLRAAAEAMMLHPNLDRAQRQAFEEVILREANLLSERLEALDREYRNLGAMHWPMADVHSTDLFSCVIRTLSETGGPKVTMVGIPLWLHADSHSLALALERVLRRLVETTGATEFDIEALLGDRRVYVEITWSGAPVPSALLDRWTEDSLIGAPGSATLRDILARHGSEMWSRARRPGRALLRIPVPAPLRVPLGERHAPILVPRPEFYDFDLLHLGTGTGTDGARPLRQLTYVVFDTETTGLRPSDGDEIIAIGAVRIVNGRILTGETFNRLVNPKRSIPAESIRFHGITDSMVADAPPIETVLPQFKSFVADAVLVAHNAAFDLRFLKLKERDTGVRFNNVPLDTLLISAFLFPDLTDHSLDGIARRLGLKIVSRHNALGDAMATAAILVRFFELLEGRGINTLDDLLSASRMTFEIRARAVQF